MACKCFQLGYLAILINKKLEKTSKNNSNNNWYKFKIPHFRVFLACLQIWNCLLIKRCFKPDRWCSLCRILILIGEACRELQPSLFLLLILYQVAKAWTGPRCKYTFDFWFQHSSHLANCKWHSWSFLASTSTPLPQGSKLRSRSSL